MIYLHTSICIYVVYIRLQQEAIARSENDKIRAPEFPSNVQPLAAKKVTEPFDIRFAKLPPVVVEARPRIQVELLEAYQVPPPRLVATS